MSEAHESLWLGRLRKPVRILMVASIVATAILVLWVILGRMFFGTNIGMKQFLSPAETPIVMLTMLVASATLLIASVYLSDSILSA